MENNIKKDINQTLPENTAEKKESLPAQEASSASSDNQTNDSTMISEENPAEVPPKPDSEMVLHSLSADNFEELPPLPEELSAKKPDKTEKQNPQTDQPITDNFITSDNQESENNQECSQERELPPHSEQKYITDQKTALEQAEQGIQSEINIPPLPNTKEISSGETIKLSDKLIASLTVNHNSIIDSTVQSNNKLNYTNESVIEDFKYWLGKNQKAQNNPSEKERKSLSTQLIDWLGKQIFNTVKSQYELLFDNYQKEVMRQESFVLEQIRKKNPSFKNAVKGKEYQTQIDFPEQIKITRIEESKKSGLAFQILPYCHSVIFNGILEKHDKQKAESIKVDFYLTYEGRIPNFPLKYTLTLTVNPDPWDLWQDIPTSESIPYYKPDIASQYIEVSSSENSPGKNIIAASRRGRSHANSGTPRDDDFQIEYCKETDWYLLAVADGAGSAKYSRQGSKIACRKIIEKCKEVFGNSPFEKFENLFTPEALAMKNSTRTPLFVGCYHTIVNAAKMAQLAIEEEVKNFNKDGNSEKATSKDFATTLLFAACKKFPFGWVIITFSVGDGAIAVISNDDKNEHPLLAEPDEGIFSGQTRFLTMPDIFPSYDEAVSRLHVDCYSDFEALILMTDGVSDPLFESTAQLHNKELWEKVWNDIQEQAKLKGNPEEAAENLLQWLNFKSPGNHDDRTIAILY